MSWMACKLLQKSRQKLGILFSGVALDYVATHKGVRKLPAVFPIVLYNGQRRWTAAQEIAELIETGPELGSYALRFQYLLLNEKSYTRQQLLAIRNIVSTLFLAEAHYDIELLEQELLNLYEKETDKQAISLFLNWFRQLALYGKVSPEDYGKLDHVYRTKEEVQTMLAATFEEERKKIYEAGRIEGREEGREEGRAEAQRQMIGQLLQFRFDLTTTEQKRYAEHAATIQDVNHLDELVDVLLNKASTLEDFVTLLARHISTGSGAHI